MISNWVPVIKCFDSIEIGDKVRIKYNKHRGHENEELGDIETKTGKVTSMSDKSGGGVFVNINTHKSRPPKTYKLHNLEGGTVTTKLAGSITKRIGLNAEIKKLSDD